MKRTFLTLLLAAVLSLNLDAKKRDEFEPNWESLTKYKVPEWWQNAKFGIYFHWGPYSVPGYKEWYSHWMYMPEMKKFTQFHDLVFGGAEKFGYKDFIPMFTGEKFDANEWAKLFKDAGAQFAGPCVEHAEGFAMWDSDLTRWNSVDMGPGIDVVGEMQKAVKKQGMKYIITYHRQWLYGWFPTWNKKYDTGDPQYSDLYGPLVDKDAFNVGGIRNFCADELATEEFSKEWYDRLEELMDKYDPDIIWFDNKVSIIDPKYRMKFLANFYNDGIKRGKEVVCTYKFEDFKPGSAILDLERARMSEKKDFNWLTDDSMDWDAWCYNINPNLKSTNRLLDFLVDVVSKNGAVLLNVTPTPTGVIPRAVEQRLREIGEWLKINGEAIYDTRPWVIYGEGPQEVIEGHLAEHKTNDVAAEDIRFTVNGKQLYATSLGYPESGKIIIKSLATDKNYLKEPITKVKMLGCKEKIVFKQTINGLEITFPRELPMYSTPL